MEKAAKIIDKISLEEIKSAFTKIFSQNHQRKLEVHHISKEHIKEGKNGEEYFTVKIRHREPWTGENKKTNKSYLDSYDPSPQKEGSDIPF